MIHEIELRDKKFSSNIFYAPLAGCSDYPFRMMTSKYNPGLIFCEMVKMEALIRLDEGTLKMLDFASTMRPIGAQLCGANPKIAGQAAKIIEDLGFDTLDFNCGCPVDKVTKDGSGSGMLKDAQKIGDIIAEMRAHVSIPVSVKIRAGWDEDSLVIPDIVTIAEAAGASCLTLHGRTREQGYSGNANWDWITLCKKHAKNMKIFGNGDVFSAQDAIRMLQETKCDGVLVARGTLGSPWIVDDIKKLANNEPVMERSLEELREALLEHLSYVEAYFPERKAILDMRRVGCWYFKNTPGAKSFRGSITKTQDLREVRELIRNFPTICSDNQ